mgnify:CR=1 FL=1
MRSQLVQAGVMGLALSFAAACDSSSEANSDSAKNAEPENTSVTLSDVSAEKGSADTCVLYFNGGATSFDVASERACLKAAGMLTLSKYTSPLVNAMPMQDGKPLGTGFQCGTHDCERTQMPKYLKGGPQ